MVDGSYFVLHGPYPKFQIGLWPPYLLVINDQYGVAMEEILHVHVMGGMWLRGTAYKKNEKNEECNEPDVLLENRSVTRGGGKASVKISRRIVPNVFRTSPK